MQMDLLIKKINAVVPVSETDKQIIRSLFQKKVIPKNGYLLQAGQTCRHLFFIETGLVRYYSVTDGEEKTNYFNKEAEWVCDYPGFIPQSTSTVNIQALEPTTVWTITYENLQTFYLKVSHGERYGRLAIEYVFIDILSQILSLYKDKPEQRYEKFLKLYADIAQRIPQYYIASYVGVKAPSLSRIRKRIVNPV